jgi:hypothetical protein
LLRGFRCSRLHRKAPSDAQRAVNQWLFIVPHLDLLVAVAAQSGTGPRRPDAVLAGIRP